MLEVRRMGLGYTRSCALILQLGIVIRCFIPRPALFSLSLPRSPFPPPPLPRLLLKSHHSCPIGHFFMCDLVEGLGNRA